MFINNLWWPDLIKKFEISWKGVITLNDFIEALFEMDVVDSGAGLEIVFKMYDWDGNGTLDLTEFYTAFEEVYNKNKVYWPKQPNWEFYDMLREKFRRQKTTVAQIFAGAIFGHKKIKDPIFINPSSFKKIIQ